jgi:acyl-CoA synthetase (AMP-forming)/AMP-acid ligase II
MNALTIPTLLAARRADTPPDRAVLVADDRRLTYANLDEQSRRLGGRFLAAGIAFGTRVALLLPNDPDFVVTWFALTRIGAVAVPISTSSSPTELRRILRHANVSMLVSVPAHRNHAFADRIAEACGGLTTERPPFRLATLPHLRAIWMWGADVPAWTVAIPHDIGIGDIGHDVFEAIEADVSPGDVASIIYTSGSTAEPKGIIHTHGSLLRGASKCRDSYDIRTDDRMFTQMPFFWVGGLTVNLLAVLSAGATQLTTASTNAAEVLAFLERERASNVMAWPHLARAIAADPTFADRDLSCVRVGSLWEAWPSEVRPHDPTLVGSALGMTETAGPHTIADIRPLPEDRRGSFGPPQPGMSHRVIDPATGQPTVEGEVGELLVRGDTLMLGMVRRERADTFEPDGWYRTGDLVSVRDGHFHFHGRLDDLIKSAGANVSPREVEDVLLRIPGVLSATVSGVNDSTRGQVVGAVIVSGADLNADAIRVAARQQLSPYKVPRLIVILAPADVPMMSSGKVNRLALIGLLRDAAEPQ